MLTRILTITLVGLIVCSCAIQPNQKLADNVPKNKPEINPIIQELSERSGVDMSDIPLNVAQSKLQRLSDSAIQRYTSNTPLDVANLSLKPIFLTNKSGQYKMRDIELVITRGDSRIVSTSDMKALFSGVSTNLRITLALDGSIWLNGVMVGLYSPSTDNYFDAKVPALNDGNVSVRVSF